MFRGRRGQGKVTSKNSFNIRMLNLTKVEDWIKLGFVIKTNVFYSLSQMFFLDDNNIKTIIPNFSSSLDNRD